MSSGQWEVVGKSKKSQNGKVKTVKEEDKKPTKNGPKLEDVVAPKSYYSGMEIDDTRKSTKDSKKIGDKKNKKKSEPAKPKPPKTIEEALEAIDPMELANIITTNRVRFTNAPLVWLKEIASFLNSKTQIDVDDPTFSNYPLNYPLCVMPVEIRKPLESVLHEAGKANTQLFFDVTLTAIANDMTRGQSVNGHRILLQMLAHNCPDFCVASLAKSVTLRNSYQNRPPIGLSLLWVLGQGGLSNFAVGMKAWQELFLPIVELKNYSKYAINYLEEILARHGNMASTKVSFEQLIAMFDMVNNKRNALSKELSNDLIKQLSKYKDIYFSKSGNKLQVSFNHLMKKLPNQYLSGSALDPYHRVMVESLVDCLHQDDSCNATWRQLFSRCSKQSATLMEYIDTNWDVVSPRLKKKSLRATVIQFQEVCGETLRGKKKDETVVKANKICQDILDRMKSTRRFPWLWASFLLLVGIAGLVAYDVQRVGGDFPKSTTGKLMKDLGILEQSQYAWQKTLSTSARGYLWLETNAPIYYTLTVEAVSPYAQLSKEALIVGSKKLGILYGNMRDYIVEKTPVVVSTIDQYAPGVIDTVQGYAISGFTAVRKYSNDYYQLTADYLKTKVFVGEWAPEILQSKTELALNATRFHMTSYFHWFRHQVHVYSEIP
ncbi:transmembrane protein 214 [Maniola hyperantus]|uniref:transmembrane protein 214 n=1 Tax=Aphantopus hyperantus TaxID=2795564 RepID=UPI00156A08AA|nr:transmembrane protein 214 [Maniola hyperantus]